MRQFSYFQHWRKVKICIFLGAWVRQWKIIEWFGGSAHHILLFSATPPIVVKYQNNHLQQVSSCSVPFFSSGHLFSVLIHLIHRIKPLAPAEIMREKSTTLYPLQAKLTSTLLYKKYIQHKKTHLITSGSTCEKHFVFTCWINHMSESVSVFQSFFYEK